MKTLEEVLIDTSNVQHKLLYGPAKKAIEAPETGITINTPAARQVIKDCAEITVSYLPFYILSKYANPFFEYKKKVTIEQIRDFVNRSRNNPITHQLKVLLLNIANQTSNVPSILYNTKDIYNDVEQPSIEQQQYHNDVYILAKAFDIV